MASLNRVFLLGNLTRDPEIRYTPSGKAVGDLRMAVGRKFKKSDGSEVNEVCYITVVVWDRQAETCGQYLTKGAPLLVEGRLQYDEWEKDGQKQNRIRVVAERVQFIGAPKGTGARSDQREPAVSARAETPGEEPRAVEPSGEAPSDDDNLPF